MAEPTAIRASRPNVAEFSVSELAAQIKRALEQGFGHVRLKGEIAGYRGPHSSGHCYFALKDDKAKIEAVIWRGVFQSLRFKPEEGLEVIATGKITTYPGSSKYQIVIESLEPAGVGALMALLEERKKKLAAEGLFAPERKRPLPFLPRVVGIVTSPTGAVIRDMLHGFNERFPTHVLVWPVRVQGETSAREVAAAIAGFNALPTGGPIPRPDVLIVARGGGSLEDLWGFNEEIVVRAAAASAIPLIAAVGHETDWTLLDLVADARAPTPTKAAEWAVPKHSELIERTGDHGQRLRLAWRRQIEALRTRLSASARGLPKPVELVALPRQRFDTAAGRLARALQASTQTHAARFARVGVRLTPRLLAQRIARARDRVEALGGRTVQALSRATGRSRARLERLMGRLQVGQLARRTERGRERLAAAQGRLGNAQTALLLARRRALEECSKLLASLSYQSILQRGFALVRSEGGEMVRRAGTVAAGSRLEIEFADGRVTATTQDATEPVPGEPRADPSLPRPAKVRGTGGQGSLF